MCARPQMPADQEKVRRVPLEIMWRWPMYPVDYTYPSDYIVTWMSILARSLEEKYGLMMDEGIDGLCGTVRQTA